MAWWAVLGLAVASAVPAPGDALGCDAAVFDPAGQLSSTVARDVAETASALGADVHVRAEPTLDTGLDARMAQLEALCPSWSSAGERADDLVVVMYSVQEREASVFYGAGQGLEDRWEAAVDAMGEQFRDGDYSDGVEAGLRTLRDPSISSDDGSSSPGIPPWVWLFGAGLLVLVIYDLRRFARTGEWGDGDDDRTSRRRSFSSSSSRRSSSSSRRSGRSGGGTKKW
jgi:uncharacterized membrane protein YgcG